uniref:mRNA decapping protein 2 Box A domain-containing protein n=1 Tax=Meleagris gallopavo TaxID=9103 RepID=A0A803XM83_MELGA
MLQLNTKRLCKQNELSLHATTHLYIPGTIFFRFILHIPSEERDNAIRVCFQIELAHWFYLDFYMQNTPGLPQCGIRDFAKADILFIVVIVFCLTAKMQTES